MTPNTYLNDSLDGDSTSSLKDEEAPKPSFNGTLSRFTFRSSTTSKRALSQSSSTTSSSSLKSQSRSKSKLPTQSPNHKTSITTTTLPSNPSTKITKRPSRRPQNHHSKRPTSKANHTSRTKYAHLPNNLHDSLPPNLHLLFIGVNPGLTTAATGHVYAHPSNLYWRLLHKSGITPLLHLPSDTYALPDLYNIGNTNIVSRPTRDQSEIAKEEMEEGVEVLEQKIRDKRPRAVCIVGKGVWETIFKVKVGRALGKGEFGYGWQELRMGCHNSAKDGGADGEWKGAPVFVATTTSGLAAGMRPPEKEAIWAELGKWVLETRTEADLDRNLRK